MGGYNFKLGSGGGGSDVEGVESLETGVGLLHVKVGLMRDGSFISGSEG